MIVIKQDSELMTNYVAANPVPAGQRFAVFKDALLEPAVLALSEDSILNLIMVVNGKPTKIDFGKTSGIVSDGVKVQAFAAVQAPDNTLDICIATKAQSDQSSFTLLHAVCLDELINPIPQSKIIRGLFQTVCHIYLVNKSTMTESLLPVATVAFKNKDRVASTEDLRFVEFSEKVAVLGVEWDLATNPEKILDVQLGTSRSGDGIFTLYQGFSKKIFLQFTCFTGDGRVMTLEPQCPEGATCLATFVDPNSGQSVLLVGGKDVTSFVAKEYTSHTGKGTVIDSMGKLGSLKDIHLSQVSDELRIWYTTESDAVYYYTTKTSSLANGLVTPLLAEGKGGQISSMLALKPASEQKTATVSSLISVDEFGNLFLLQQDSVSMIWQQYPFWHDSSTNVMEVKGYTLRMEAAVVKDPNDSTDKDDSSLLPGCWLRVSSSGFVRCIINGRHVTLSTTGKWYQTDAKGVLNIVLQTEDASCHQFAADGFKPATGAAGGGGERALDAPLLDPTRKVTKKLDGINTADDLRALKKPNGDSLFPASTSDDDLKNGATAISTLMDQIRKFHSGDQQKFAARSASFMAQGQRGSSTGQLMFWDDIADGFKDAWHWVTEKLKDVSRWGVELIEDAAGKVWSFIIHIGDEIHKIFVNTISSIVKGFQWIFQKLGALFDDVIKFLGHLFGWDDILDTTKSLATSFNVALDYGQDLLTSSEVNVQTWLEDLRTKIKEQLPTLKSHDYKGSQSAALAAVGEPGTMSNAAEQEDPADEVKSGVTLNFSMYQFTYGGGTTSGHLHDDDKAASNDGATEKLLHIWDDIQVELKTITKLGTNVVNDFVQFFISGNYDVQALVSMLAVDLIDGMIDSLKTLADIIFQAISLGIDLVRSLANDKIDIPVLSWLWKHVIAQDTEFTLLNMCALVIAIPTTILYKAKKGGAPPKLFDRLDKDAFGKHVTGQGGDPDLSSDIKKFSLASEPGLELVYGGFETIALLADGAFEGMGLESMPTGPVLALMNIADSASLTFETMTGFTSWPVEEAAGAALALEAFDVGKFAKYSKWGLKLSNKAALAVVKIVAKAKKAERPVTKRWRGTVAAVVSVPTLCVALVENINDSVEAKKNTVIIVDHYLEALLAFGKAWGFAAASWTDEIENPVMYAGLAAKQVCGYARTGLKIADFVIEKI